MRTAGGKVVRAALSFFPWIKRAPERHGVRGRCASMTPTAALPAHCRLVSGHDLWLEMVAAFDCTVGCENAALAELHRALKLGPPGHSLW